MDTLLMVKIGSMVLAVLVVVISLLLLGKKKAQFQKYPEQIKKELYKSARMLTILNIVAVAIVVISYFVIKSNYFFFLILFSLILSTQALLFHSEDFDEVD